MQDFNKSKDMDTLPRSPLLEAMFESFFGQTADDYKLKIKQEVETEVKQNVAARAAEKELAEQKEKERHILKMLLIKGMDVGEIASIMDLSEESIEEMKAEIEKKTSH